MAGKKKAAEEKPEVLDERVTPEAGAAEDTEAAEPEAGQEAVKESEGEIEAEPAEKTPGTGEAPAEEGKVPETEDAGESARAGDDADPEKESAEAEEKTPAPKKKKGRSFGGKRPGSSKKTEAKKQALFVERRKAVDTSLPEDEQIEEKLSRATYTGVTASKKEKSELDETEKVITEDGDQEIETMESVHKKELVELRGAARSGRILEGEIIGFRQTDPDDPSSLLLAEIRYGTGSVHVSIPVNVLFDFDEQLYATEENRRVLVQQVKKRITATVRFVPAYVDEKSNTCYGDRLRAEEQVGKRFYLSDFRGTGGPRITAGLIVKSRILAVGMAYVVVNAIGADIRIPREEISYMHVGDARTMFTVDDFVNVKILSVGTKDVTHGKNHYRLVDATGSIRQAYPNLRKKYFDQYPIGTYAAAEITHIDEEGHVYCLLNGGQIDCMCPYPKYGIAPVVGQKRVVKIELIDENNMFLYGVFQNN